MRRKRSRAKRRHDGSGRPSAIARRNGRPSRKPLSVKKHATANWPHIASETMWVASAGLKLMSRSQTWYATIAKVAKPRKNPANALRSRRSVSAAPVLSAARHRSDDQERLASRRDRLRERRVGRLVREVFLAREEAHEGPALARDVVPDRPAQHRKACLERVENRTLRRRFVDVEPQLAVDARQRAQVRRQHDADRHGNVCASTDSTAGRSWTIASHESPPSRDAYTCPPVVPK